MFEVPPVEQLPVPLAGRYSPAIIEYAYRRADTQGTRTTPFPTAGDRAAWQAAASSVSDREALLAAARQPLDELLAPLPATLFLDFDRTGRRRPYEVQVDARRQRLRDLVLAYCLTLDDELLDPILDFVWAICEESDWCRPAHQPRLADPTRPFLDLSSAMTALQLAETDHLLGERLAEEARARLRTEIDRRCFTPYLERHDFHWMFTTPEHGVNTWAAVIAAGVVGSACYLEQDRSRLAELTARGLRSLDDYRAGFDEDGGTSEGNFCWSFGFGFYTMLADLIEHRSGGLLTLWDERSREIALFPLRTYIAPDRFVNFSDCPIHFTHTPSHLAYLGRRLEIPELLSVATTQPPNFRERERSWALRDAFWAPEPGGAERFVPQRYDDLRGLQWLVARQEPADPDALVLAAKGGHNSEMHNQNDVGHFTVDAFGEPLLVDLGKGGFNRAYFRHTGGRYDFLVNASRGHSVPLVNGFQQAYGRQFAARELERAHDDAGSRLVLDLAGAYPDDSGLASLRRTIYLDRVAGTVEMTDEATFAAEPGEFESALISLSPVTTGQYGVTVHGRRGDLLVKARPEGMEIAVEEIEGIELEEEPVIIRRITFRPATPQQEVVVSLSIVPRPHGPREERGVARMQGER